MRTCVSCGDEIAEKKRKDAKYCDKPGCRGRAYRKRQAEAEAAEGKPHTHAASTVLACPCGRRYKIQISALDESESKAEPAQSTAPPQVITETVLHTAQRTAAPDVGPELQAADREAVRQAVLLTDLEAQTADTGRVLEAETAATVTQAVLLTDQQPAEAAALPMPTPMYDPQGFTETDRSGAQASGVLTLELYFLRAGKHRLSLHQAVIRRRDGTWTLQPQTRAAFSLGAADRPSLGGRPGGWGRYYAGHSPVEFGYEEDLVVMFWDQKARRGWVAQTGLLRELLGDDWKAKLREHAGGA